MQTELELLDAPPTSDKHLTTDKSVTPVAGQSVPSQSSDGAKITEPPNVLSTTCRSNAESVALTSAAPASGEQTQICTLTNTLPMMGLRKDDKMEVKTVAPQPLPAPAGVTYNARNNRVTRFAAPPVARPAPREARPRSRSPVRRERRPDPAPVVAKPAPPVAPAAPVAATPALVAALPVPNEVQGRPLIFNMYGPVTLNFH